MPIRALLVDDEPLARTRLRRLLRAHPQVEVVGEAGDGEEACRLVKSLRPDLLFLDIQMPGLTGFDVLRRLAVRPHVVFVTAHDEFAVQAFEEQAVDYLLKPIEPPRLARALRRLPETEPRDDRIERLLQAVERSRGPAGKIAVRRGSRIALVEPAQVVFVRAEDKYTILYTADAEHVLDRTIEELERMLDPAVFLRIHRAVLVNLNSVRDLTVVEGGRYLVALDDRRRTKLHASRSGARALRERLGL